MPQPVELHVVLIDVGTYDFLSVCHNSSNFDAKLMLFFDMSDHKIVGGLFLHKPVGIPDGAFTNAKSQ